LVVNPVQLIQISFVPYLETVGFQKMPTMTEAAVSSGCDTPVLKERAGGATQENAKAILQPQVTAAKEKYRHISAYHSQIQHSCLSRDSGVTPSFIGFRNLMVIVLGSAHSPVSQFRCNDGKLIEFIITSSCHESTING
jgi:hypothetical protein